MHNPLLDLAPLLVGSTDRVHANFLTIPVGAVAAWLLGALWYSPLVFGKLWLRKGNKRPEELGSPKLAMIVSFISLLVMAIGLYVLVYRTGIEDGVDGVLLGGTLGLAFIATSLGTVYAFAGRGLVLWLIDAGYQVMSLALIGALMGLWHG